MSVFIDDWRQRDFVDQQALNRRPVTLIGAGGIGSHVADILGRLGLRTIEVFDPDCVESHNLTSTIYRHADAVREMRAGWPEPVGRPKVEALTEIVGANSGMTVIPRLQRFPETARPRGIVICAVDSMDVRIAVWHNSVRRNMGVFRYIEARMGLREGRIYTVNPNDPADVVYYEDPDVLYPSSEADPLPCSAQAVGFNTSFLGGLLVSQVPGMLQLDNYRREVIFDLASLTLASVQ